LKFREVMRDHYLRQSFIKKTASQALRTLFPPGDYLT
jgi:hypothetical protein